MDDFKIEDIIKARLDEQKINGSKIVINEITEVKSHKLDIKFTHENDPDTKQFKIFDIECTVNKFTINKISIIAGDNEDVAISTINNLPFKCGFICGINGEMMAEIKLINEKYYAIIPKEGSVNYRVELDLIKN